MGKVDQGAFRIAFVCAESFYGLALPYITKAHTPLNSPASMAILPGEVVASATNLALSLELYLKSLKIFLGMSPGDTHQLWALFKHIPATVKSDIENRFNHERKSVDPTLGIETKLAISSNPNPPIFRSGPTEAKDLKSLLIRSQDAFVTWRYIYESVNPDPNNVIHLRFEHDLMRSACHAVRDFIRENDPQNSA